MSTYGATDRVPPGEYGRICDVCASFRPSSQLRQVDDQWVCVKHPGYVSRRALEERPLVGTGGPEPVENAKPWQGRDIYEAAELDVFNLISRDMSPGDALWDVSYGPPRGSAILTSAFDTAWAAIYLYELIAEAQRPLRWVAAAKTRLQALVEWLLARQVGGPRSTVSQSANNGIAYGGFDVNLAVTGVGSFTVLDGASAGIAFLRAYQVFGTDAYYQAALRCADFVRTMQCGDLLATVFSSADAAGTQRRHFGAHTAQMATTVLNAATMNHTYYTSGLVALEFMALLKEAAGDLTIGYSGTISTMPFSRAATLSTCIAEALAFWTDGVYDSVRLETITGLSTTTPREYFSAYRAGGGTGAWAFYDGSASTGTTVTSLGLALAIRALSAAGSTAFADSLFDWLMTFTSNTAYELPATTTNRMVSGYDERYLYAGVAGTYNPKTAPAMELKVRAGSPLAATATNGSSLYDLAAAGLLAEFYSERQRAWFTDLKWQLTTPRPRGRQGALPNDGNYLPLGILGCCGLSWQPYTDAVLSRQASVFRAAMTGLIWRQAPTAFGGRGLV